jgi:hypothetical protein
MVKREVPLVENYSLLYSWHNLNAFFEAFGIKTLEEFDTFYSKENSIKLGFEDIAKIVGFGLQRKDKSYSMEEVNDIIDEFMEEKTMQDILELAINAQMSAMITTSANEGEAKGEAKTKPPRQSKT